MTFQIESEHTGEISVASTVWLGIYGIKLRVYNRFIQDAQISRSMPYLDGTIIALEYVRHDTIGSNPTTSQTKTSAQADRGGIDTTGIKPTAIHFFFSSSVMTYIGNAWTNVASLNSGATCNAQSEYDNMDCENALHSTLLTGYGNEWAVVESSTTSWISITFDNTYRLQLIRVMTRAQTKDSFKDTRLTFSDGEEIEVRQACTRDSARSLASWNSYTESFCKVSNSITVHLIHSLEKSYSVYLRYTYSTLNKPQFY